MKLFGNWTRPVVVWVPVDPHGRMRHYYVRERRRTVLRDLMRDYGDDQPSGKLWGQMRRAGWRIAKIEMVERRK